MNWMEDLRTFLAASIQVLEARALWGSINTAHSRDRVDSKYRDKVVCSQELNGLHWYDKICPPPPPPCPPTHHFVISIMQTIARLLLHCTPPLKLIAHACLPPPPWSPGGLYSHTWTRSSSWSVRGSHSIPMPAWQTWVNKNCNRVVHILPQLHTHFWIWICNSSN